MQMDRLTIKSQEALQEAQRIAHIGNWDLDLVHNVLHWSDEIYRIFEIDPEKFQASYGTFLETVHPDDRERMRRDVDAALRENRRYAADHRVVAVTVNRFIGAWIGLLPRERACSRLYVSRRRIPAAARGERAQGRTGLRRGARKQDGMRRRKITRYRRWDTRRT